MGNYKDLNVWKRSKDLAVTIYKMTTQGEISKDFGLRDQMKRSAVSIPSNIAEGDELDSDKQSIRHFYIAKGSLAELQTQLTIAKEVGYINEADFASIEKETEEISSMLRGLIKHRSSKK